MLCYADIADIYQDTYASIVFILYRIMELQDDDLNEIFYKILSTKYCETRSLLLLLNTMKLHYRIIPQTWVSDIKTHISSYWIRFNNSINEDIPELMHIMNLNTIDQLSESYELICDLNSNSSHIWNIQWLLNNVNYSDDTILKYIAKHPEHPWILKYYEFKQKVIKNGSFVCRND